MPLLCPVLKEHYRLASKSWLDAVYHDGSAQRVSDDTYDQREQRDQKEQKEQKERVTLLLITVNVC